nr:cytochrome b6/f complex subunit VI [Cycas crassipes]YP_010900201.1 cytochrome b6/f complex subunit VI [Cycas ferruginea]YP_010900287.1 cytochrome b6/f complex subunit VI [Cycas guizhouensis]YP_010900373.1 cytochrome b6/f complex subunit VI [Cycas longisporophylla]WHS16403.1 cytochrome b6/f complex subunit VI [Cycas crassipes]WHS16489.1 cytochrome b6/f complex subunit VI [Cycas ferruginea]WHS16575.1 cytochrome b6/f complex subunit VI [Cycas guizhouensis]WHS16661.1 cytochrome b6/f complex s
MNLFLIRYSFSFMFVRNIHSDWLIQDYELVPIWTIYLSYSHPILGYEKENLGNCLVKICSKRIPFSFFTPTITSYFGFLLASLIFTLALFIGSSKIRLL